VERLIVVAYHEINFEDFVTFPAVFKTVNFCLVKFFAQVSTLFPSYTKKKGFVTATKLGTTNKIFVAATKNFAAATKRLVH